MSYRPQVVGEYRCNGGKFFGIYQKDNEFHVFLYVRKSPSLKSENHELTLRSKFQPSREFPPEEQRKKAVRYLKAQNPFPTFKQAEDYLKTGFVGLKRICTQKPVREIEVIYGGKVFRMRAANENPDGSTNFMGPVNPDVLDADDSF